MSLTELLGLRGELWANGVSHLGLFTLGDSETGLENLFIYKLLGDCYIQSDLGITSVDHSSGKPDCEAKEMDQCCRCSQD